MRRNFEGIISIILKCLFIYDLLHLFIIKPIEGLLYRRLSASLIISSHDTLHMSFDYKTLLELRTDKSPVKKLFKIKNSFLMGLEKLDFNDEKKYYTYVNEIFYSVLTRDKKMVDQRIISHKISSEYKNQCEAKLLLLKTIDLWQLLFSDQRRAFLNFLFRKEKILRIEFLKSSAVQI